MKSSPENKPEKGRYQTIIINCVKGVLRRSARRTQAISESRDGEHNADMGCPTSGDWCGL
jgi:hypothetical protein